MPMAGAMMNGGEGEGGSKLVNFHMPAPRPTVTYGPVPLPTRTQVLLTKYNIGIDPEQRNKSMVEAVAKRVGFKLPEQHAD